MRTGLVRDAQKAPDWTRQGRRPRREGGEAARNGRWKGKKASGPYLSSALGTDPAATTTPCVIRCARQNYTDHPPVCVFSFIFLHLGSALSCVCLSLSFCLPLPTRSIHATPARVPTSMSMMRQPSRWKGWGRQETGSSSGHRSSTGPAWVIISSQTRSCLLRRSDRTEWRAASGLWYFSFP